MELAELDGPLDGEHDLVHFERLGEVFERAGLDGPDGRLDRPEPGQDDPDDVGIDLPNRLEDLDPVLVRHPKIGEENVEGRFPGGGNGRLAAVRRHDFVLVALEDLLENLAGMRVVVNDESAVPGHGGTLQSSDARSWSSQILDII